MLWIRKAVPGDAAEVRRVHRAAVRRFAAAHYDERQRARWTSAPLENYRKGLTREGSDTLVAIRGGRVVAFATLFRALVKMLYVHPSESGKGTGSRLLRRLEATARRRGLKRLRLESSLNAVHFYQRMGWRRGKALKHNLGKKIVLDCVRMTRSLALLAMVLAAGAITAKAGGPFEHQVLSASSPDGLEWTVDEGVRVEHASVPTVAVRRKDDAILLYFVDASMRNDMETTSLAVSRDGLHFKKVGVRIRNAALDKSLDPCIVPLKDGRYRLYYFAHQRGPLDEGGDHEVRSAVSKDGVHFVEEGRSLMHDRLVDPDVFRAGDRWLMYVFSDGGTVVAESQDGKEFTLTGEKVLPGWGTTAPVALPDGTLRLYAFEQRRRDRNEVHSFLSSDDAKTWKEEAGVRLKAPEGCQYTDPFVVAWKGAYKMYFKQDCSLEPPPARPPRR